MRRILLLSGGLWLAAMLYGDNANYAYDNAGRLTSITYPNGTVVTYTYDAVGNLTSRTVAAAYQKAKPQKKRTSPTRKR